MKLRVPFLLAVALPLAIAAAAPAVIIDLVDGTSNTSAPSPDPGWAHVGRCNGYTVVYVGGGWVLTANHVGPGDCVFVDVVFPWEVGSAVQLHNPDNSLADLLLFHVQPPFPPLPSLVIASAPPTPDATHPLYLIGRGRDRGAATTWNPPGPDSYSGYLWDALNFSMRWGTNHPEIASYYEPDFLTHVFGTLFDETDHTVPEAQGAHGDSGGAVFAWNGAANRYELAGILIGIGNYPNQPSGTALYGNKTYAADLSLYRDEIVETMPEPDGGLFAGVALLAALASVETRRACRGTGCAASSPRRA